MSKIKLNVGHLNSLFDLENECFPGDGWTIDMLKNEILNNNNINLGFLENKTLVGYLITLNLGNEIEILRIGVASKFRNRGIAKKLITWLIDCIENEGVKKIFLEVSENNMSAKALYESLGFKKISSRKNYYKNGLSADIYVLLN